LPQKISNAEIVVVVGADAEDVPSSIAEYLLAVVVVVVAREREKKESRSGRIPHPLTKHGHTLTNIHHLGALWALRR